LRVKLVRLLMVSFGIMILGLAAVIAAIIYKINEGNDGGDDLPGASLSEASGRSSPAAGRLSVDRAIAGAIDLPAGGRITASSLDGDHALITLVLPDGAIQLLVIDLPTGKVFVRYDLRTR